MATIENFIRLRDGFSPALDKISRASNTVADKLNRVGTAATAAGDAAEVSSGKFNMLKSVFMGSFLAGAAMQGIQAIQSGLHNLVSTADEYAGMRARLLLVSGSQQNVAYLNQQIYESAQRARGGYLDLARAVSQLAISTHDAFPDPRAAVEFTEGIQKLFVIGGSSKEAQKNAMLQLTQGMSSGQLQGDEFRSIAENAPIIENMIAKTMGVSRGELKALAAEGKITADVIRDSILNNMDEINAQFETMPKRWGDHFTSLSNIATHSFAPVFDRLSDMANSDSVRFLVDNIAYGIMAVAPLFYGLINLIQGSVETTAAGLKYVGDIITTNAWIGSTALYVLGAAALYVSGMMVVSAVQAGIAAAATAAKAIADWAETAALIALTLAQDGFNVALAACPITWIIGAIVALIGVIYLGVAAVNYFAGTNISATGLIFAAFAWLATGIMNTIKFVANGFIAFANFLGSVFQDPVGATYNLFTDIWNGIVDLVGDAVNSIIDLVNQIPGVDKIGYFDHIELPSLERKEIANAAWRITPFEYGNSSENAADAYEFGAGLGDQLKNIFTPQDAQVPQDYDTGNITPVTPFEDKDNKKNNKRTADNTQRIADKLDMTDAEIKELREAAITPAMAAWQSQNIVLNVENHNNVASDIDIDGMTSDFVKGVQQALSIHREGVTI